MVVAGSGGASGDEQSRVAAYTEALGGTRATVGYDHCCSGSSKTAPSMGSSRRLCTGATAARTVPWTSAAARSSKVAKRRSAVASRASHSTSAAEPLTTPTTKDSTSRSAAEVTGSWSAATAAARRTRPPPGRPPPQGGSAAGRGPPQGEVGGPARTASARLP